MIPLFSRLLKKFKDYKNKKQIIFLNKKVNSRSDLTSWEKNFIKSIKDKNVLTDKQFIKLKEIAFAPNRLRLRGSQCFSSIFDDSRKSQNSDPRYCDLHGVSWDDVHDFDRD